MPVKIEEKSGIRLSYEPKAREKRLPWMLPGVLTLLLAILLITRKQLIDGLSLAYNHIAGAWMLKTGEIVLKMSAEQAKSSDLWLFLTIFGVFLTAMLYFLGKRAAGLTAVGLLALTLAMAVILPDWCWLPALLALLLTAISCPVQGKARWKLVALQSAVCLLCAVLLWNTLPETFDLDDLQAQARQILHARRYEPSGRVLPEGDLTELPSVGSQTVLQVTMKQPEELYLRGFVGEQFDGQRWTAVSYEQLAEHADLIYWLQEKSFHPQSQFARAAALSKEKLAENHITVINLTACSKYLYTPYNLNALESGGTLPSHRLELSALYADGSRSYTFTTVPCTDRQRQDLLALLQTGGAAMEDFLSAEGSLRKLLPLFSPDSPEEVLKELQSALDALCAPYGGREQLTLEQAEICVLKFLEDYQAENLYRKATATVIALRYFGIPARYAEGFHIPLSMAELAQGDVISVTERQAGAWAEVYQDGTGWIPLELTPGYMTLSGGVAQDGIQANGSGVLSSAPEDIPQGEELEEQPQQESPEQGQLPQMQPQTEPQIRLLWPVLAAVLLLILLTLLIIWLRHHRILMRRMASFRQENIAEAIGWLFSDAAAMLEKLSLCRGGGSMETICAAAEQQFGAEYAETCRSMVKLNGEALFSSHSFDETQRQAALAFRGETLVLLQKNNRWHRRLWLKWIKCMY